MAAPATASLQHPRPPGRLPLRSKHITQAEFSLTQIWDQAVSGRCFFEEIIRENIDLGRPEQVQLIFSRKMNKSTVADEFRALAPTAFFRGPQSYRFAFSRKYDTAYFFVRKRTSK
ncbi:MAG: hypothetical protein QOH31_2086 [Verrucomicrobiota bacterium]|jgi:hypothetical protein